MISAILIYVAGFFLSLLFLSAFGKSKMNIDYDSVEEKWPDDWDSNAEAFVAWSLMWPIGAVILAIAGLWMGLTKTAQFLINLFDKDNE